MKKIKRINELTEDEFEDFMFFKTDLSKELTKLNFGISAIVNPYFNKNIPHIFIFKDSKLDFLNYTNYSDWAMIKLSSTPSILINNMNLNVEELASIFQFIRNNKKILMKYWNWKCSSFELKNKIKDNNERINRI